MSWGVGKRRNLVWRFGNSPASGAGSERISESPATLASPCFLVCFLDLKFAPRPIQEWGELQIQHTRHGPALHRRDFTLACAPFRPEEIVYACFGTDVRGYGRGRRLVGVWQVLDQHAGAVRPGRI